jgi:hypothetical protein
MGRAVVTEQDVREWKVRHQQILEKQLEEQPSLDVERAIEAFEQVVEQSRPGDPALPAYLSNLSEALGTRYERTKDPADLERAIDALVQAVRQSRPGDPGLPAYLSSLGSRLRMSHDRSGAREDLENAIEVAAQAVEQSPPNSLVLTRSLRNLSGGLYARYTSTGDPADLERSNQVAKQAEELVRQLQLEETQRLQQVQCPPPRDDYVDRLLKYIPAESVALYLTLQGIILAGAADTPNLSTWLWFILGVGLIGTPWYQWRVLKIGKAEQLAISAAAFGVWVFALGGAFESLSWYEPFIGSLALVLFTFFAPLISPDAFTTE